ncbi:MAG: hypothetical protein HFJ38_05340 [Bacilli bacterium]|nr:hypothetical protein [Bacilli bacterium]
MNNLYETLLKYNIKPQKYKYINKACILYTEKEKYVVKSKKRVDKDKLYDYLLSRDFTFFLYPENDLTDDYEIYSYLDEIELDRDEKAKDLMFIMSDLHNRTTSYKDIDLDKIKEIYEEKQGRIDYLFHYYNDLEEVFMMKVYNSPAEYLLLRNIDKIYNTLNYSRFLLEDWYKRITNNKKMRISFIHNRISLEHFIAGRDAKLINFDYAKYDCPIYDYIYFYKKHYKELDMDSLYQIYQHKFKFTKEEELLFFIEIIIPDKIRFTNDHYNNCLQVYNLNKYLDTSREFILKEQKKDQKRYDTKETK